MNRTAQAIILWISKKQSTTEMYLQKSKIFAKKSFCFRSVYIFFNKQNKEQNDEGTPRYFKHKLVPT